MKSVKTRIGKKGQAVLSLVETIKSKNTRTTKIEYPQSFAREKKIPKIRSDYDQVRELQTARNKTQTQHTVSNFIADQAGSVDDSLWLCIYFPKLSIDITKDSKYKVVYQEHKGQCFVYRTSAAVADNGVIPGMTLDAARTLCPELNALARDVKAENKHIQKLADWAYRYSSELSVINNNTLVLEVGSSTRLFKGLKTLCELIGAQLSIEWKLDYRMVVSPAPLASITLAQQNCRKDNILIVMQKQALRSVLGKLPVSALLSHTDSNLASVKKKSKSTAFSPSDIKNLNSMGVSSLSQLWRLPSRDLLTRFGIEAMRYLDRLLGVQADPVKLYEPAMSFEAEIELPLEAKSNKLILQALSKLLDELITYLIIKDAGTDEIRINLIHSDAHQTPTPIIIQLRQCLRDKKHIFTLIEERFNRVTLEAPVIEVSLVTNNIEAYNTGTNDLFEYDVQCSGSDKHDNDWKTLLEKFNARLGKNKITRIASVADHRPERAWRYQKNNSKPMHHDEYLLRPLWLLPEAVRLVSHQTQLELLHGPERIENGWWDGSDIRRDYYIARDKAGSRLWVYCDLKQKARWYVHGLFA